MPSIKTLDYTIREARNGANTAPVITDYKLSTFAKKDEIKAVSDRITAISERLDKMEVAK
jgi:flagellar biosynthesis/type III secretory pathway chaperone